MSGQMVDGKQLLKWAFGVIAFLLSTIAGMMGYMSNKVINHQERTDNNIQLITNQLANSNASAAIYAAAADAAREAHLKEFESTNKAVITIQKNIASINEKITNIQTDAEKTALTTNAALNTICSGLEWYNGWKKYRCGKK